jgi:protein required for attachment to host cells
MLENGKAWFLVADGRRARVLIEERRGADLQSPPDWNLEIEDSDLYEPQDRRPRNSNRIGLGKHTVGNGRNLHEAEEDNFLKRVAERLGEAEKRNHFDHLVIAAPPRALGTLRDLLPSAVRSRVRAEAAKDVLDEPVPKLRERLQALLR